MKKWLAIAVAALVAGGVKAAIVFQDNFNTSQGSTFTTSGPIGSSVWSVTRSGADWGARIHNNILETTNDATTASNADGWVFVSRPLSASGHFNPVLSSSAGLVTWSFNMRQIRTDPAGFIANSYGVAFVLGSNSTTANNTGSGYAVVLGQTGPTDPIRLAAFTGGLSSLGTGGGGFIVAGAPLNDVGNEYLSLQVTYNPANHLWSLYGRNDGASFSDPLSGTLTLLGSATNSEYTNISLGFMGAYWQGSTTANQTAFFDNVTLQAIPEPGTLGLVIGFGVLLAVRRRARR